jgi:hypothetical protein
MYGFIKIIKVKYNQITSQRKKQTYPPTNLLKLCAMTNEINYELMSELIFTNDEIFDYIDIDMAKILTCLCKNARLNINIKLSFDRFKAREYFDKIGDIIYHSIIYIKKKAYLIRENIEDNDEAETDENSITSQYNDIIDALKKENDNVLDGFRELIILEFKEYIYNYENWKGDSFDIQNYLDYCDQYYILVNYFGYYEYCESHTYDPTHFVLTPDKIDYDFVRVL